MRTTVGKSFRTPAKHAALNAHLGREAAALTHMNYWLKPVIWYDMSAGDAETQPDQQWSENCSAGIFARHARTIAGFEDRGAVFRDVQITLSEKARNTYDLLLVNLDLQLPQLGYERRSTTRWVFEGKQGHTVDLNVEMQDSAQMTFDGISRDQVVFLCIDPNNMTGVHINDQAHRNLFGENRRTTMFVTMGCNPGGLKMLPLEARENWFKVTEPLERRLANTHDIVIAAIDNDRARWGYLVVVPEGWRDKYTKSFVKQFLDNGFALKHASIRNQENEYEHIQRYLFLTNKENEQRNNTQQQRSNTQGELFNGFN